MKTKEEKSQRVRKDYAKAGERTQKMFSFRLDNENADLLLQQPNRGRYINDLIAADRHKRGT